MTHIVKWPSQGTTDVQPTAGGGVLVIDTNTPGGSRARTYTREEAITLATAHALLASALLVAAAAGSDEEV